MHGVKKTYSDQEVAALKVLRGLELRDGLENSHHRM